jgi:serine/threonine-protein kinase
VSVQTFARGRYEIERTLGGGGMAVVYLALDSELGRPVAVKVLADNLADDADLRRRFVREARLAARLSHPNVVRVYDAGEEDDLPYIVMECVEGESLAETLRREGRLEPARVTELGLQACAGLEHAHRAGLVHRDVKPANLLLTEDGTLKIADFGIAHATEGTRVTEVGTVLGTAAYLSPEQATGERVTAASDIYSLGVCLYELLSGGLPYDYETLGALLSRRDWGPPPRLEGVPPALEHAIHACLARDPGDRPVSAAALARDLSTAGAVEPATAATRVVRRDGVFLRIPRRLVWGAALTAVVVAIVAVALALAATDSPPTRLEPVPAGSTPAEDFRNLADWLRERSES